MAYIHDLGSRLFLIFACNVITALVAVLFLIHLPLRLFQKLASLLSSDTPPPPKVEIVKHESLTQTTKDTLLLIHGFPDSPKLYENTVAHLTKQGYRCLVAGLPSCKGESFGSTPTPRETTDLIHAALKEVHADPVTIIGHDWGAFYTVMLVCRHPDTFKRAVFLDVGSFKKRDQSATAAIVTYQLMLALMYFIGHPVGSIGTQLLVRTFAYKARPLSEIRAEMCYHYYSVIRALVTKSETAFGMKLPVDKPQMFIYGMKKGLMFHDEDWLKHIRKTPEGEAVGLSTGHWITLDAPTESNELLTRWLDRTHKLIQPEDNKE